MSNTPVISTVIPFYNNPVATVRAVMTILRQSVPVHEIILIDDASNAVCSDAIRRRLADCTINVMIRYERLAENAGPGFARHLGAALATGSHVAFLDSDDLWHRDKIAEVSSAILATGAVLVGHQRPWAFHLPRRAMVRHLGKVRYRNLTRSDFLRCNPIPTSSIVARIDIARCMFRFGGRKSEDYMALIVAERMAGGALFLDAPLCWAKKPPFGYSGEGANPMAIYRDSFLHMLLLRREGVLTRLNLLIFFSWLALRIPVGMARFLRYRRGNIAQEGP